MKNDERGKESLRQRHARLLWLIAAASVIVILIALLMKSSGELSERQSLAATQRESRDFPPPTGANRTRLPHPRSTPARAQSAEEIVSSKVASFVRSRREVVHAMATHFGVAVPRDVEQFMDLAEAGRWDELNALFKAMQGRPGETAGSGGVEFFWPAIVETHGVVKAAQTWPAQKLLEYGNAILSALLPEMLYVGGTDAGRFIPTLLNETSDGARHIVLTQNALADNNYLRYLSFLYGEQFAPLTEADSREAFQTYIADAQKRARRAVEFPDEPNPLRPGEDVRIEGNRVHVSGEVAVMGINEVLLGLLRAKNPDLTFAIEQSFSMMYGEATPLGPIMKLSGRMEDRFTDDHATRIVDYWQAAGQELLFDSSVAGSSGVREAYAKLAGEQASLLLHKDYAEQAEQVFRIVTAIDPGHPEMVSRYAHLLLDQDRIHEAVSIVENALRIAPDNQQLRALRDQLQSK
jgi:tetratricopeptide (TPR) repeat protein